MTKGSKPYKRYKTVVVEAVSTVRIGKFWDIRYERIPLYDESEVILSGFMADVERPAIELRGFYARCTKRVNLPKYKPKRRFKLREMSGRMSSIYALINPLTNEVFYVGSTACSLPQRASQHYRHSSNYSVRAIMCQLMDANKRPIIKEICKCPTEFQFYEEKRWILGALKKYKLANQVLNRR